MCNLKLWQVYVNIEMYVMYPWVLETLRLVY